MEKTKKESRGRKRKFDLEAALAVAQAQFHQNGYEGAKLADICAALGITQTSLYAAYGNKIDLYRSVVDRYARLSGSFVAEALAGATSPDEVWTRVLHRAADVYGTAGTAGCLVLGTDVATTDADARQILSHQVERTRRALVSKLEAVGETDYAADADALVTVLRGLSGSARAGALSARLHEDVRRLLARRDAYSGRV